MIITRHRSATLILVLAFTQGCTTLGPVPAAESNEGAGVPGPTASNPTTSSTADSRRSASARASRLGSIQDTTQLMLAQARTDRVAGRLDSAESTIERALRIEPNNPLLWIELGEIKLASGDRAQARTMGRRAMSLSGGDAAIENSARRLINL